MLIELTKVQAQTQVKEVIGHMARAAARHRNGEVVDEEAELLKVKVPFVDLTEDVEGSEGAGFEDEGIEMAVNE